MAHVQIEAAVTLPEKVTTTITNTFHFQFVYDLPSDEQGRPIPPRTILPNTGAEEGGRKRGEKCTLVDACMALVYTLQPVRQFFGHVFTQTRTTPKT